MASPLSLSSVITPDSDIEKSKPQEMSNTVQKESNNEVAADGSTPSANTDIPQWKKDLIQRRRINVAKTMAANQSVLTPKTFGGTSVMALDTKALISAKNNSDKLTLRPSNANAILDTKSNTSQHSLASAANVNSTLKMPGMPQQHDCGSDSPCGGHYTPVNNKSSGNCYNYTEKQGDRTQEENSNIPQTRSFSVVEEYNNEGSISASLQENVQFRKNPTEQYEAPNTTSADSLLASTSRLSSVMKVAVAAENYKKSNKDNFLVCVSEHKTHTLQEPALTTYVSGNNNGSGDGVDDEQPLHHQLKSEHEVDSLAKVIGVGEESLTKFDAHILKGNNNLNSSASSVKVSLNKKQCGLPGTENTSLTSTSCFVKNPKINSTLVSSHHNHKINTKYRFNQNSTPHYSTSAKSSVIESPSVVTNNKKKMVAVQEMNEISNNELDFDPSEELQYGPGIVSKLRCRYLSLALRQATGKQRLSMRRATSLNNLLDDNDIHDDDEEEDHNIDIRNKESTCKISDSMQLAESKAAATLVKFSETTGSEVKLKNLPCEQLPHRSRHIKRGNDSLKRARSVEALLCEKSPWNFSDKSSIQVNNSSADTVTIEDKINHARDRLLLSSEHPPKRLTSIIDDTERPPPDVVKQTLKIFEATANRRGRGPNRNSGGEVAIKVANYKSIITQNKPIITFPKPSVSPKKSNLKSSIADAKKTNSSPPTTPNTVTLTDKNAFLQSSTPATSSSNRTMGFRQKVDLTPIRNPSNVCSAETLSENSPDIIPRHKSVDKTLSTVASAVDSPVTQLTKRIEHLRIESPTVVIQTQQQNQQQSTQKELRSRFSEESSASDSEDDSIDGEYEVNKEDCEDISQITKLAMDNIGKAGTSQQFQSLSNGNSVKFNEPLHDIPTLPSSGTSTVKQIGIIKPLLPEKKIMEGNSGDGGGGKSSSEIIPTTLTSREIEKNRINNEKKIEKLATNSQISELYSGGYTITTNKSSNITASSKIENPEAGQSAAWSNAIIGKKKRTPAGAPENNTMVFNFKDRKEVPDYIENDGLLFKRKRELPKPNESGYVMLGDLSLETSTDPDDEWPMCPPSPCDVEFENANIIIDGKSSIKNRSKDIHFRVQFDDSLTSTFEYPSETSIINDSAPDYTDLSMCASLPSVAANAQSGINKDPDVPTIHHHVAVDEIIQLPNNNKIGNLSLGSAPLGSYTPVKAKIDNVFQLGVTRVPNNNHLEQSSNDLRANFCREQDDQSLEYIKPASDDLTIAYSEGSLKTDLLY